MWVKPDKIKVPDVRVTSSWDPELLTMFRDSIKSMGIVEPIVVVLQKEDLWLVDGLHRLQEAQLQNLPKVQVVAIPGSLQDVYLKNLMLNRMRGKTKISEMVRVIKHLETEFKMDMDTIARSTGLKRDYVEKMMVIGRVHPDVLKDMDSERIHLGHAEQLGRVDDSDTQLRLLAQIKQFDISVSDFKDIVEQTLQLMKERQANPSQGPSARGLPPSTIECHFCELQRPIKQVKGFNVCQNCFAIAYDAIKKAKAATAPEPPATQEAPP
jgi:ParB-like chromosome segregation protein Spo0J